MEEDDDTEISPTKLMNLKKVSPHRYVRLKTPFGLEFSTERDLGEREVAYVDETQAPLLWKPNQQQKEFQGHIEWGTVDIKHQEKASDDWRLFLGTRILMPWVGPVEIDGLKFGRDD